MRVAAAPVLLAGLFTFSGLGLLVATGLVRRSPAGVLAALGLAYLTGIAAVLLVAIVLLTAGVPVRLPAVVASSALIGIGAFAVAARRGALRGMLGPVSWPRRPQGIDGPLAAVFLAAFAVYALLGFRHASVLALDQWDAWSLWTRKATALLAWGDLRPGLFASDAYAFTHLDYPILIPVLEAVYFRAAGTVDTQALHVQFWTLLVAFVWAAGFLAARVGRARVWAPILAAFAIAPGVSEQLLTLYADVPLGMFLCLGVLLLGLWLADRRNAYLALGVLLLAAAANTKNEGLIAAVAALVVLAILVVARPPARVTRVRALRPVFAAIGGFLIAVLPWRIWIASHDIESDLPLGDGLNPSFLADRFERVGPSLSALTEQLAGQGRWFYLVPISLAVVSVSLAVGVARRVAAFYLLTGLVLFASLIWAYWISPYDLDWHIGTSVARVASPVVFVALAALLQLSAALERQAERQAPP